MHVYCVYITIWFVIELIWTDLTHWGWVTHICVGNLTIIGSDNGLSPGRRQAITWTNVGLLLIGPLESNVSEILIELYIFIQENLFENVVWKMAAILSRSQCVNTRYLSDGTPFCQCSHNDAVLRVDEGTLTDTNQFPITQIRLGDINEHRTEYLWQTLGPLECILIGE